MDYDMSLKRTILSEKEIILIEDVIAEFGIIVTFEQVYSILKKTRNRQSARNLINKLTKNGWLVRIMKGVYAVASLESRGSLSIHPFKIARTLVNDSYISFEAALQYHGMFDQMLRTVVSISLKRRKDKDIHGVNYKFVKTKKDLFFGWSEERIENHLTNVASCEKAILDMLMFDRNEYYVDLVYEKLKEYKSKFDFALMGEFSVKYSKTVQRIAGFLFDKLSINSDYLYKLVGRRNGCSYMIKDSGKFNAKWSLYYCGRFDED